MRATKDHQRRVRNASKYRRIAVVGRPCVICSELGTIAHHIIPVRNGGSFGKYNLLPACSAKHHSRLNKLSNGWMRRNKDLFQQISLAKVTELCKAYVLRQVEHARELKVKRQLERDGSMAECYKANYGKEENDQ